MDYFGTKYWDTPYWVPSYMAPPSGGGPALTRYSGVTIVESVNRGSGTSYRDVSGDEVYDYEDR